MGTINIYNDENNRTYQINVDLIQSVLDDTTDGSIDMFLRIRTNIPNPSGPAFGTFLVRSLADVAPGKPPASNFDDLILGYIEYFSEQGELGQSSSSSSSSSTSSFSSSSSSSELYSESSESSSDSTEGDD